MGGPPVSPRRRRVRARGRETGGRVVQALQAAALEFRGRAAADFETAAWTFGSRMIRRSGLPCQFLPGEEDAVLR